jgi:HTH-type transcriptional regulator, global nitrogen regulator NrpRI
LTTINKVLYISTSASVCRFIEMSFTSQQNVERKILSILKVLSGLQKPAGSVIIAKQLKEQGVDLSERAVRYHLRLTDERGLTQLIRDRDGRVITDKGLHEIESALVNDKVGFAIARIEQLAFRTNFDLENRRGPVPVNISFFAEDKCEEAFRLMEPIFEKGFTVSRLVKIAPAGQMIGTVQVPAGNIGLASACSIITNGVLLKAGVPMDSRFGGILQMQNNKPVRFTEIIHYSGCSLDPSEIFIKARMTSVRQAVLSGNGEILANFREIPAICQPTAYNVISGLKNAGFNGVLAMGNISESVCEINVDPNKIGIVLIGGLNPVAAVTEAGIEVENHSMSEVIDYSSLIDYREAIDEIRKNYSLP